MSDEKVRLASLGLGWWGGVLAKGATDSGAAEVVTCFARTPEARQAFAEEHGCRTAASLEELLEDPEVEGVLIATPHTTHADLIEQAASAGKHVFVEKPLTLTVEEGRQAVRAADEAGILLQVGHNRRRQPANRRIKRMIEAGELGTVYQLEANQSVPAGHNPQLPGWRRRAEENPAGGMAGMGVHMVDTFHYFIGSVERLFAFSKQLEGKLAIDDATTIALEYQAGPLGYIGTSYFLPRVTTLVAYGTDASAWNEEDGARFFLQQRQDPARQEQQVDTLDTIADELAEFARCIREGAAPETGGEEGLEVVAVYEAVVESAASGKPVELKDFR